MSSAQSVHTAQHNGGVRWVDWFRAHLSSSPDYEEASNLDDPSDWRIQSTPSAGIAIYPERLPDSNAQIHSYF